MLEASFRLVELLAALGRLVPIRGRGMLAQVLYRRLGQGATGHFSIRMADGTMMVVPRSSSSVWIPLFTGAYDEVFVGFLVAELVPETVAIDVGACFGFWTVPLAMYAQRVGARVIAVEPVPANVEVLRTNVERNGLSSVVTIVQAALDSRPGRLAMHVELGGVGNASVARACEREADCLDVVAYRLDDVVNEVVPRGWRVSAIKLDVEGWEVPILRGAGLVATRHRPVILGEFDPWWQERHGIEPDAVIRWAAAFGYQVYACRIRRRSFWTDRMRVSLEPLSDPRARGSSPALLLRDRSRV